MGKHKRNDDLIKASEVDCLLSVQENNIYRLVNFLMHDVQRLGSLVLEAREKANMLADMQKDMRRPYPFPVKNIYDCSFDDDQTMKRYFVLYEDEAPNGWF